MAGNNAASRWLSLLSLVAVVPLSVCSDSETPPPADSGNNFDRTAMLASIATRVIVPTYQQFADAADTLRQATEAYATALERRTGDAAEKADAARTAWRNAMSIWQEAELMQLGPAGSVPQFAAGEGLRDEIYSWPTVNSCAVDQQIIAQEYQQADFTEKRLVNVYGLDALEYLLFQQEPHNTCPAAAAINRDGQWTALPAAEVTQRRARYSAAIAKSVASTAAALAAAWDPARGDFVSQLAAQSGSVYATQQQALDQLFAAMFYIDTTLKDTKLATPAGLPTDAACGQSTCPELLESRWSQHSKQNIRANLISFQRLFLGDAPEINATGFDDWLAAVGAAHLADRIGQAVKDALGGIDSMTGSLAETLSSSPATVKQRHLEVKAITDRLKDEFVNTLQLKIPEHAGGDAD